MSKLFYPKLALSNIRKNSKTYVPYIITCVCSVMMCYIMFSLARSSAWEKVRGSDMVIQVLNLGTVVVGIFCIIFLFYTNSFLMKRRKKEIGLYNILGMEKRHISKILLYEAIFAAAFSLIIGLLAGLLFGKLTFLGLLRLMNFELVMGFEISIDAIMATLILFGCIYLGIFLNTLRQVHLAKPIELLKGGEVGEKEPKTKWLTAIFGFLCLGGGYYLAIMPKDAITAIMIFFAAVILVIIGTYLLFTTGSIAVLKLLRKNKSYYYKEKHFISVSGMIYRMKQNAVGLANICILSTMVLVMISSTASLYLGVDDAVVTRYPGHINYTSYDDSDEWKEFFDETVTAVAQKYHVEIKDSASQRSLGFLKDNTYYLIVPLEEYQKLTGEYPVLNEDEVLLYSTTNPQQQVFIINDLSYRVQANIDEFVDEGEMSSYMVEVCEVVVKDMAVMNEISSYLLAENAEAQSYHPNWSIYVNFDTEDEAVLNQIADDVYQAVNDRGFDGSVEVRMGARENFFSLHGGLFFLGIFLGLMFTMATVLIIYYKQISEGYEDKMRFEIMQKVGLSRREVKKTIHSQVLSVFYLPLIMAGIHILFAFPMIKMILSLMNLTNAKLFGVITVAAFIIFSLLYAAIYAVTAKVYYKIVSA